MNSDPSSFEIARLNADLETMRTLTYAYLVVAAVVVLAYSFSVGKSFFTRKNKKRPINNNPQERLDLEKKT